MKVLHVTLIAGLTLVSGAARAQPAFAPPPLQDEVGPPPPLPGPPAGYVLVPGRWDWNGVRYVWVPRHWIVRRVGYAVWVPGHWGFGPLGRYRWIEGHWRR
jgi:hypothetical protein